MEPLPYPIRYSARRKRIGVTVIPDTGQIVILAPVGVTPARIAALLREQPEVITALQRRFARRQQLVRRWKFQDGETFPLLGQEYPLKFTSRLLFFDQAFLVPRAEPERVKANVELIYRKIAQVKLTAQTRELARQFGLKVAGVGITSADTRWGSCSAQSRINYSWKLMMCNTSQVRYVICHELAHLTEFNHSPRFWRLVGEYCPDYASQRESMKKILIDW